MTTFFRDADMNASNELNFKDMEASGRPDQLSLRRLKKQKLALKDQIVKIEDDMIPDIIA